MFSQGTQFFSLSLSQIDAIKKHLSCSRAVELNESASGGGFPAAAFAYQSKGFTFFDFERDIVNSFNRADFSLENDPPRDREILF
jgi:hypothetical protein